MVTKKQISNYNTHLEGKQFQWYDNGVYNLRRTLLLIKSKNESVEKINIGIPIITSNYRWQWNDALIENDSEGIEHKNL
jgi:hypothetical protein